MMSTARQKVHNISSDTYKFWNLEIETYKYACESQFVLISEQSLLRHRRIPLHQLSHIGWCRQTKRVIFFLIKITFYLKMLLGTYRYHSQASISASFETLQPPGWRPMMIWNSCRSLLLNCGKPTNLHQSWEIQNSIERDSIAEFEPDRFVGPVHR